MAERGALLFPYFLSLKSHTLSNILNTAPTYEPKVHYVQNPIHAYFYSMCHHNAQPFFF